MIDGSKDNLLALYEKYRSEQTDEDFEAVSKAIDGHMGHVLSAYKQIPDRPFTI